MAVKNRANGKFDVELRGKHVKRLNNADDAAMLYYSGKRLLELGKPLDAVIAELRGESGTTRTLDEYFESWLPLHSIKPQSEVCYRNAYARVSAHIGKSPMAKVDAPTLKRVAFQLQADGLAPYTIRQSMTLLKSMLNDACDDKLITDRPPRRIKNMPEAKARRTPFALSHEQHKLIVEAAKPLYKTLFAVWPLIGGRRGEMVGLRWEDRENGGIWIRRQVTNKRRVTLPKYDSVRFVRLGPKANALLDDWQQQHESYVIFPGPLGGPMGFTGLQKAIVEAREAVGVDLHAHIFRHTAGSWWIASRCFSLPMVARMMGHRVEELVSTYTHEIEEADKDAVLRYDAWLDE